MVRLVTQFLHDDRNRGTRGDVVLNTALTQVIQQKSKREAAIGRASCHGAPPQGAKYRSDIASRAACPEGYGTFTAVPAQHVKHHKPGS